MRDLLLPAGETRSPCRVAWGYRLRSDAGLSSGVGNEGEASPAARAVRSGKSASLHGRCPE